MRRGFIITGAVIAGLLLIQFVRPEKNLGNIDTPEDFIRASDVPDTLARIILNSCYDCHSNHTNYPWYGSFAPVSWFLQQHVNEGKAHLNFSSWGLLDKAQKISRLDQICEESSEGTMPLKSYLLMHADAGLGPAEIEAICDWAEKESIRIMGSE
jgi:hypothetical protein